MHWSYKDEAECMASASALVIRDTNIVIRTMDAMGSARAIIVQLKNHLRDLENERRNLYNLMGTHDLMIDPDINTISSINNCCAEIRAIIYDIELLTSRKVTDTTSVSHIFNPN